MNKALKRTLNESPVSTYIPISHLNSPTVFETKDGQIGCIIKCQGLAFDTKTNDELNSAKRALHNSICRLGDDVSIYEHILRVKMDVSLSGTFADDFSRQVDAQYHRQFNEADLYANQLYITVLYKGVNLARFTQVVSFFDKLSKSALKTNREAQRQSTMDKLKRKVDQLLVNLARFKPSLLGADDPALGTSEIMTFYARLVNALEQTNFLMPRLPLVTVKGMDGMAEAKVQYPDGNIAPLLPSKRIAFQEVVVFRGANNQLQYGSMLSLMVYGAEAGQVMMLDPLLQLDCEFIYTNSFAPELSKVAEKKVNTRLIRLATSNDAAHSLHGALADLRDDLAAGRVKAGYHHNSLLLLSDSREHLQLQINKAIRIYGDIGFVARQETIGQEAAFWAQLPGNQRYIARSTMATSENLVDFFPLHNYPTGYRDKNHLGAAITLIESPSKTPIFFNYHASGRGVANDLTAGHTTLIGGNGSGKTVFMSFMDLQEGRYGGRTFVFDRDRSWEIYIRAAGGRYALISPNHAEQFQFNPLCLPDTPNNRAFLNDWLSELVKKEGESEVPASISAPLEACIQYAYGSLAPMHRNLSNVVQMLPIDFPRRDELNQWLRGTDNREPGKYAYLFDQDIDTLDLSVNKFGFDMTHLMKGEAKVLSAVCKYLVHRIELSKDGSLISLTFEEGWQILNSPYWKKRLEEDLPTFRKYNIHINLATQSPRSVVTSSLSAQFLDNAATNIFFCNDKADHDKDYRHFNLSPSEFAFIKETPKERRLFLYKQGNTSMICRLNLSGMDDTLAVLSGNIEMAALLDTIRTEVGDDPNDWLPIYHQRRRSLEEKKG